MAAGSIARLLDEVDEELVTGRPRGFGCLVAGKPDGLARARKRGRESNRLQMCRVRFEFLGEAAAARRVCISFARGRRSGSEETGARGVAQLDRLGENIDFLPVGLAATGFAGMENRLSITGGGRKVEEFRKRRKRIGGAQSLKRRSMTS